MGRCKHENVRTDNYSQPILYERPITVTSTFCVDCGMILSEVEHRNDGSDKLVVRDGCRIY